MIAGDEFDLFGDGPDFDLVEIAVAEIEHRIGACFHMEGVSARRQVSRLRVVGIVIITARLAADIGLEGDLGGLVAADPRLGGPQRKAATAHVEIGHLLAAAPDVLIRFRNDAQPEAVDGVIQRR